MRRFALVSLTAALCAGTASADTLREALVSTYSTNPTITAQRESLKSTDATVAIAATTRGSLTPCGRSWLSTIAWRAAV